MHELLGITYETQRLNNHIRRSSDHSRSYRETGKGERTMKVHTNMINFLSCNQKKLNHLLFELDNAEEHAIYNSTPICDISGICEVCDPKESDTVGTCFFCGTELIKYNGSWYHHTAFNADREIIDDTYQTHNYAGSKFGEPTTVEEREILYIKSKITALKKELEKDTK